MKRKKILHFVSGLEVGGTETQLLRILPFLQNDLENRVCCFTGRGPIGKEMEKKGIRVHYLHFKGHGNIQVFWRLISVIREFNPDILVTYLIHCDLIGRLVGRIAGVKKIVCSQRGSLLQWEYLRFFDKLTKFLVTKYLAQTETAKKELVRKLKISENKIIVIPNGINLDDFNFELDIARKKETLKIASEDINIVCVGKLREGKGHEYLLEAFEKIHKKYKSVNLFIVGDGEKMEKLIGQIKDYESKKRILFLGDRSDVKEILKISDIFILPTLGEGMSNAILEAMASNVPIITTDIKVNKEILKEKESGIIVPIKNSAAIAYALENLINDKNLREYLSKRAKKDVSIKYDIKIVSSKLSNFLISL